MNILRSETFTCFLTFFTFALNIRMCVPVQITGEKTPDKLSKDFENFLNDMGSMVYQYKKRGTRVESNRQRWDEYSYSTSTTMPIQISMRKERMINTQKSALREVLMMKLVSYYENKYKITDHGSTTTDMSIQSENNKNNIYALDNMNQTQHIISSGTQYNTQRNLDSKGDEAYVEEVIVM